MGPYQLGLLTLILRRQWQVWREYDRFAEEQCGQDWGTHEYIRDYILLNYEARLVAAGFHILSQVKRFRSLKNLLTCDEIVKIVLVIEQIV